MTKQVVSLGELVEELKEDLQKHFADYPSGVYLSDLADYYGESASRLRAAALLLEARGFLVMHQTTSRTYFFLPPSAKPDKLAPLTGMQLEIVKILKRYIPGRVGDRIRTSYAQLARISSASTGGVRSAIERLVQLGYIQIVQQGQRGHSQSLMLEFRIDLSDQNLDS